MYGLMGLDLMGRRWRLRSLQRALLMGAATAPGRVPLPVAARIVASLQQIPGPANDPGWPMWYVALAGRPSNRQALQIVTAFRTLAAAGRVDVGPPNAVKTLTTPAFPPSADPLNTRSLILIWPQTGAMEPMRAQFNLRTGNIWTGPVTRDYIPLGPQNREPSRRRF